MKKKSKGRVKKFEQENNILQFPGDAARSYGERDDEAGVSQTRYNTQELYDTPLYGNEEYDDPDYAPGADFTRNESYEPSSRFDLDAFMEEGWENIRQQAAADISRGDYGSSRYGAESSEYGSRTSTDAAGSAQKPHFMAADAYGREADDGAGPTSDPMIHRPKQESKDERKKKRVSAQKRRRRLIYFAVFAVALVVIFFTIQNVISLKMEERELLQQQRELEARKAELEEELTQVDETDYIEQQAREQLHMIKPGEILYLLPDHDDKE